MSHYVYVYCTSDLHNHLTASPQIACSVRKCSSFLLGVVGYRSKLILPRKFSLGLYRYRTIFPPMYLIDLALRSGVGECVTGVESVLQNFAAVVT